MIYLVCHVIFFFLYALWSVDHNLLTVDHNLPCSQYPAKIVSFFLTIWSMHGRSYFTLPTKGWYFPPKVETYSRCCPSICTIAPGFYIFDQKFSLTRFFPKKCVNFSLPRQKIHDKSRPIISYKRHNYTYKKCADCVTKPPKKYHTLPADVLPNANEALLNKASLSFGRTSAGIVWCFFGGFLILLVHF